MSRVKVKKSNNKKAKENTTSILPYEKTRKDYWIKNDARSAKEKALIMLFYGKNYNYISEKLNIDIKDIRNWVVDLYNDNHPDHTYQSRRRNKPLSIPNNFSVWNSKNIYSFWNSLKSRQRTR